MFHRYVKHLRISHIAFTWVSNPLKTSHHKLYQGFRMGWNFTVRRIINRCTSLILRYHSMKNMRFLINLQIDWLLSPIRSTFEPLKRNTISSEQNLGGQIV